jgi:hypothetical protein
MRLPASTRRWSSTLAALGCLTAASGPAPAARFEVRVAAWSY